MYNQPGILVTLLHCCEFIAMIMSVLYFNEVKNSYWKWFTFYLIYIFIYEITSLYIISYTDISTNFYLSHIQIPLEFIFFFWLFAYKSLKQKLLFFCAVFIYLSSLVIESQVTNTNFVFTSINNITGTFILLLLVILEFIKQIKSDAILLFKKNKMFYINIGVILFYIGSMPFMGLYNYILKIPEIWNNYYIYFMLSNSAMYLLFAASFIWGKEK